jgi:hypothetical protein
MAFPASGEPRGKPARMIHHALPGEPGSAGVGNPTDLARATGLPGEQRDLPVRDHPPPRDRANDGMHPIAERPRAGAQPGCGTRGARSARSSVSVRTRGEISG